MKFRYLFAMGLASLALVTEAGVVKVGAGSYSDTFPGVDVEQRNATPPGTPYVSGKAANRPVPTNDWWSNELTSAHGTNIFNYPMGLRPYDDGLCIVNPVLGGAMPADRAIVIGLDGLNAPETTVCDYSDWTVSINWANEMTATMGQGMPFVYFEKTSNKNVKIDLSWGGNIAVENNILIVTGGYNGANYAVYAPAGSTWTVNGRIATSNLNGKNYWSAVMIQNGVGDATQVAREWQQYAFVFPKSTRAEFVYDETYGKVNATYIVETDVKEGSNSTFLMGLLPHHWANLSSSDNFIGKKYDCIRGELKMAATNSFTTSLRFSGVLPTIPALQTGNSGYSDSELKRLVDQVYNDNGLTDWTDSYNDGQLVNRLVQTARVAKQAGYEDGFKKGMELVKQRVERWLTYNQGDIAFMFYYHKPWTALLGYPAGHGQDSNINDHHFHWGYFIHAAAFVEQFNPGWAAQYGDMVNMLVRDAASSDRNDSMFPYLRSFSPYSGHCWANGTASIGTGNDQESTSESMQFNCSLIHWGAVTGNKAIRDLGVCLYAIERSATEEYWFDANNRGLVNNGKALYARVFTNDQDSNNFWGAGIEGSYGIHVYPVHAGSFYLVNNPVYAKKLWNAMKNETGILKNEENGNIWYDSWFQLASMIDPQEALSLYNSCNQLGKKFGISQAQTYQQVHAAVELGVPDQGITADYPLATAFNNNGVMTYAVQNYGSSSITVTFSDGTKLTAQPGELATMTDGLQKPRLTIKTTPSSNSYKKGDKVKIDLSITQGDYTVVSSAIMINDVEVASGTGAAALSCEWTAPETTGTYIVRAEAKTSDGNVYKSSTVELVVEPEIPAAPAPKHDASVVKSIYSDKYTSITPDMSFQDWGSGSGLAGKIFENDNAFEVSNFNYVGIQLCAGDATVDVSDMEMLHVDLYSAEAMNLNIYPIALNPKDDTHKKNLSLAANQWTSFDIPLSEFSGLDMTRLGQFKFDGGNRQTFYVDNIYFWKSDATTPASLELSASVATCKVGESVTIDLSIDEGDHSIEKSVIKINGNGVSTVNHNSKSRAVKSHSYVWTPETPGQHTVTAEATSSDGRVFTSAPITLNVEAAEQGGGDNPSTDPSLGAGSNGECVQSFIKTAGDDSPFLGNYRITYKTTGNEVKVTAHFDGTYEGLTGAYLWDESDGFHEYSMTPVGNQTYEHTFTGVNEGKAFKLAVKLVASAYALPNGMAVTPYQTYVAGQVCATSTSIGEILITDISIYPNPASEMVSIDVPGRCTVMVFSASGTLMHESVVENSGTVEVGSWARGMYFVRVINEIGDSNVVKLIKK